MAQPVYVYGLMAADVAARALEGGVAGMPGLAAAEIDCVAEGRLAALVSDHDGGEVIRTRRNMLAHTRVLEAAMAAGTVLPMRFGSVADERSELAGFIRTCRDEIETQLSTIEGCVEYGLRIAYPRVAAMSALREANPALASRATRLAAAGPEAHFERIEFGRHVAEALDNRRKRAERHLLQAILPLLRNHVLKAPDEDVEVLRVEVLLPREAEPQLLATLRGACETGDFAPGVEPDIRLVGPVPPYNFVSMSLTPSDLDKARVA